MDQHICLIEYIGSIKKAKPLDPSLQCFSSVTERFQNERTRANRTYTAPGDYDPLTSDFDNIKFKILKQKRFVLYQFYGLLVLSVTTIILNIILYYFNCNWYYYYFCQYYYEWIYINIYIYVHEYVFHRMQSRSSSNSLIAFTGSEKRFNDYNNGINRDLVGTHIFICIYMNIYTFKYV
jgi:hypothetical protein